MIWAVDSGNIVKLAHDGQKASSLTPSETGWLDMFPVWIVPIVWDLSSMESSLILMPATGNYDGIFLAYFKACICRY